MFNQSVCREMDEEFDNYEVFASTILSHIRLVINVTQMTLSWATLSYMSSCIQLYVMRPHTYAIIIAAILLAFVCHTFQHWIKRVTRSTLKLLKRVNIGFSLATLTAILPNVECITGIGDHVVRELRDGRVAIYAMQGRRPKMEDRFSYVNDSDRLGIEFWAVYDGHGGDSAANFVETHLYSAISRRIEQLTCNKSINSKSLNNSKLYCEKVDDNRNSDENNLDNQHKECRDSKNSSPSLKYKSEALSVSSLSQIVTEEVLLIDKQFIAETKKIYDVAGTTALIALRLVEHNKLIVANVGDSRGVICDSKGSAIPLSFDHKPQQLKEHKRIKEAGGFIKFNGVWRVAGILATSRALGDYPLKEKNLVIAEPDILTFDLNDMSPKFMILASDGLWDTFSNEDAVNFVKDNLIKLRQNESSELAYDAAKNIVLEAYKRGSVDNITVILVIFDYLLLDS